jgi:hypothetical protein
MKLRQAVVLIILSVLSQNGCAAFGWINIGDDTYIDQSFIRDIGKGVKRVKVLTDYKEITSAQMFGLSELSELDLDCSNKLVRYLSETWYSKNKLQGKMVKHFPIENLEWTTINEYTQADKICEYLRK